ncbi:MAG TPA: Rieske 2Fe-2S domain-containing protein [Acidimicrobiales bacterium]|nr:Rieske 2Fe-2S domain-containing protein [Acidimicrobiales bacterium]
MPVELNAWPGNRLHRLLKRVEHNREIEPLVERLAGAVTAALDRGGARNALSGTWLGHALHPVLTDFADGAWMGASFLDVFGPRGAAPAAQRLVGFGLLAAVPTGLTGLAEWVGTDDNERRVGLLHAGTSTAAFGLYACSYLARRRGRHLEGVVLGVAGGVVAFMDGYVGGHLSLVLGVGVGQTAFSPRPRDWTPAADVEDLVEARPAKALVDGTEIVLLRRGDHLFALANRCTYRGGELHKGEVQGDAIVCPRHGCTFGLEDGAVLSGPASIPQPCLEVRTRQGRVEVRDKAGSPETPRTRPRLA